MSLPSQVMIFVGTAAVVFGIGLYGVIAFDHLLRKVIAINIMGSAVFLTMVTLAMRDDHIDAVSHAIVLTGIVVAVSGTALALGLAERIFAESRQEHLQDEEPGL